MVHRSVVLLVMGLAALTASAQTDPVPEISKPEAEYRSGLVVGVDARYATTQDHGLIPTNLFDETDCTTCPPIEGLSGTSWFAGLSVGYELSENADLRHGPVLLLQWLGRSLSGTRPGDTLPSLDQNGEVIMIASEHEVSLSTSAIAASLGYQIQYAHVCVAVHLGVLQNMSVSGERYLRFISDQDLVWDPELVEGEIIDDGKTYVLERFDRNDINQTQVFLQVSATYQFDLDPVRLSVGPFYGHTFSSTLKRAGGLNLSIDDLGGVVSVQFEL